MHEESVDTPSPAGYALRTTKADPAIYKSYRHHSGIPEGITCTGIAREFQMFLPINSTS